ncbi:MAG: hypothetical protein IT435_00500 [Phycisphaerales bacterium]|nr:hypothetical protein [Phycisphaerales bacterium]
MALGTPILVLVLGVLGIAVGVFLIVFLVVPLFKGIAWLIKHIFRFIFGMILDTLRFVGSIVTAVVLIPLILGNIVVGRWSGAVHYGRSLQSEITNGGLSIYRIAIGHPARFLLLSALTEGIEKRIPAAVAAAPSVDRPSGRAAQFDGYTIVGSLQAGGSGGKLYVANPDPAKRASFDRAGHHDVQQVVIKTFSLEDGSELPQIVRESRSLDAAKKLGLVLDHELTNARFYYAMRYVPGQPLGLVTPQLHAASGGTGLDDRHIRIGLSYIADLLQTLENYHRGGLWHKDVKPDNIIVDGQRAHLVDFGLVTPLRSSMTLTTHGTEYFRDPELVRLALKGVKVAEVDGARFDVYAVGAVLYSIIENSFPAHGVLSQVSRRCPEALRWVIRRAMADYDKRYPSAAAMLLDLQAVLSAEDPSALKPIDLPSMQGQVPASPRPFDDAAYRPQYVSMPPDPVVHPHNPFAPHAPHAPHAGQHAYAGTPVPPPLPQQPAAAAAAAAAQAQTPRPRGRTRIAIRNWWTGEFSISQDRAAQAAVQAAAQDAVDRAAAVAAVQPVAYTPINPIPAAPGPRRSAAEQLHSARSRAAAARQRATTRLSGRRPGPVKPFSTEPNAGVFMALFFFLGICVLAVGAVVAYSVRSQSRAASYSNSDFDGGWAAMTLPLPPASPAIPTDPHAVPTVPPAPGSDGDHDVDVEDPGFSDISYESMPIDVESGSPIIFVWVDMPRPLTNEQEKAIADITTRLGATGFVFRGDNASGLIPSEDRDHTIVQFAELVAVTTGLSWDSIHSRQVMSDWAGRQEDVDLVLRFQPIPGSVVNGKPLPNAASINCTLVTRHTEDPEQRTHLLDLFTSAQQTIQRGQ